MTPLLQDQQGGVTHLSTRRFALLGDEPGFGKTAMAVKAADLVQAQRILVLAPASVLDVWAEEAALHQWADRPVTVLREPPGAGSPDGMWVVSWDMAASGPMRSALLARRYDVLICDECHYMKDPGTLRTQAVLGPRGDGVDGLVSRAGRCWGLSGTVLPNGDPSELWAQLCAFGPSALWDAEKRKPISYTEWRRRFCIVKWTPELGERVVGVKNVPELRERLARVFLRRRKTGLPPMTEHDVPLPASEYRAALIAAARNEDGETAALINRALCVSKSITDIDDTLATTLQNEASDSVSRLRRITAAVKSRVLAPVLRERMAACEEKLVVMAWHSEMLDVLHEALAPFGAVRLSGDTPRGKRKQARDAFQNDPGTRVFLGQIQAAGTGITLTAAANLLFAERSWTPAENDQAKFRIHRHGQTRPTRIGNAVFPGTIDEANLRVLQRKSKDIAAILD